MPKIRLSFTLNTYCNSIQNLVTFGLLLQTQNVKITRSIMLLLFYVLGTLSIVLRDGSRISVLNKRIVRKIFRRKRVEERRGW